MNAISIRLRCGDYVCETNFVSNEVSSQTIAIGKTATKISVVPSSSTLGSWAVTFETDGRWSADVHAEIRLSLDATEQISHALFPTYQSIFERHKLTTHQPAGYFCGAGSVPRTVGDECRVALPMVIFETPSGTYVAGCDPTFSALIAVEERAVSFAWTWRAEAGVHQQERRLVFVVPARSEQDALDRWFVLATPEVPAGPDWLHEIALANYDYLSKDGRGWFADIDAACELIPPQQRHRALFCLHGWYDQIGRYCYDATTGQLDERWIAFPHIHHPELLKMQNRPPMTIGVPPAYTFRNLEHYHPVNLSWEDLRARILYARERGFRVAMYHTTGFQMSGDPSDHIADGTGLDLPYGLWCGPDLIGPTYVANPLHDDVRRWFLGLTKALLDRVGDVIDALVLDEAYYIGFGTLGPDACPGYADRAQLELIRAVADLCHGVRADLAYLTADHIGTLHFENRAFPYSLYADGIYHDAWCSPSSWQCSLIPTWRNVTLSCNWAPVSAFANTRFGVLAYDAPIATSNGCFGDDVGLAEMPPDMFAKIRELWRIKNNRKREKAIHIVNRTD